MRPNAIDYSECTFAWRSVDPVQQTLHSVPLMRRAGLIYLTLGPIKMREAVRTSVKPTEKLRSGRIQPFIPFCRVSLSSGEI